MRVLGGRWWRRLTVSAVGILLVTGAYAIVHNAARQRDSAMERAGDAARRAIQAARAANAMRWAPEQLAAAERASGETLTRQRVEQVGAWFLPDADPIVASWAAVERMAREAAAAATARQADAATSAGDRIDEARTALATSEDLATTIHLGEGRRALAAARTALDEAVTYQRAGAPQQAASRAGDAIALAVRVREHAAGVAARYADPATIARWQQWMHETIAWSRREARPAILVIKDAHVMTLYVRGEAVRTYRVELGFNWIADKIQEGDGATPEGRYRVVSRMAHLASDYHKALLIDYPNATDHAEFRRARQSGEIPASARIGGLIEIHGGGGRKKDWTNGCVAVTNSEIDDLFARVPVGTPVTIIGSDSHGPIAELAVRHRSNAAGREP